MAQYKCSVCGFLYDEAAEGKWDALPSDWKCPICGAPKSSFVVAAESPPPQEDARDVKCEITKEAKNVRPSSVTKIQGLVFAHRVFGYLFILFYLYLFFVMLPRLWSYQIEFSARTAIHMTIGFALGALLLIKVLIVQHFKRIEPNYVLSLGVLLFVASVVLIGLSAPFALRDGFVNNDEDVYSSDNRQRVKMLLTEAGYDADQASRLSLPDSIRSGRTVLRTSCVECHDLRTVLIQPRTPTAWKQTVRRMAERSEYFDPIETAEQDQVVAYLVALSPRLRESRSEILEQEQSSHASQNAAVAAGTAEDSAFEYDALKAEALFKSRCVQCHAGDVVDDAPLTSKGDVRDLVGRMAGYGAEGTEDEFAQIIEYLYRNYVENDGE